jgi:predicted nucleotidyltransferase
MGRSRLALCASQHVVRGFEVFRHCRRDNDVDVLVSIHPAKNDVKMLSVEMLLEEVRHL